MLLPITQADFEQRVSCRTDYTNAALLRLHGQ